MLFRYFESSIRIRNHSTSNINFLPRFLKVLTNNALLMDDALARTLTEKIDSLPDEYISLKQQARKYLRNNSNVDKNETVNIFHRPWVAPFNWGIMLYKGASPARIEEFSDRTGKVMPNFYGRFLSFVNGAFIYNLSLYGISSSVREKNLLDRSILQCHDLILANNHWIQEYNVE